MNDIKLYEKIAETEKDFPIKVRRYLQKEIGSHWHEHIELLHILNGSGTFFFNAKNVYAESGETLVVNSNELHYMTADEAVDYICVIVDPSVFDDADCKGIILENKISGDRFIADAFMRIYREYSAGDICSGIAIKGEICLLLAYMYRKHASKQLSRSEYDMRIARMRTANKILNLIHEHYGEPLSTADLAERLFLSESHLCRLFKQAVGMSPMEYVNKFRVDKACVLLKNTDESISEIARAAGFENLNYFDRIFKRYKNISPGNFRKI